MSESSTPPIESGPQGAPPPVPPPAAVVQVQQAPPPRRSFLKRVLLSFAGLMFLGSILLNLWLLMLLGMTLLGKDRMDMTVIRKGQSNQVVAVVELTGAIGDGQAKEIDRVCRQYPHLTDDQFVTENRERWLSD